MIELLHAVFSTGDFMPHGACYLWKPGLIELHLISDAVIGMSYTTIPFTLAYFVRKRADLPFSWIFMMFGTFIISCGATHYMEIWTLWHPVYWVSGIIKLITAVSSVATAFLLVRLIPQALALPSPQQLRESEESLEIYAAQLEGINRQLRDFGYSVAHDLRAPARTVVSFSELILHKESDLTEEARGHFSRIKEAGHRMSLMLDGLLALSQLSQKKISEEPVDLALIARQRIDDLAAQDPGRKVGASIAGSIPATGDSGLLGILMQNLIDNAWKFTRDRPDARIEVGRESRGSESFYFVRDNGRGFDPAQASQLFKPFCRLPNAGDVPGVGIGLASAARIIEAHGGKIWVESRPGAGTTFFFTLGG